MKKFICSVIIPNWNGKELLKPCLKSLREQAFKEFEVIVVDNGSVDGSVEYIRKNFAWVKLITLDKNYGFAGAVNKGIKASKSKYIVLLNNDTEVDKNCLLNLVKAAKEHQEVGFVAAKMLKFNKRDIIDSAGDYIDVVGHANNLGMGEKDSSKFNIGGEVFLVTGGGGLFKRQVFESIGLFDEDYFAYFEDVDLCLRAQLQGYKGWFEPRARIYHIHKATSSKIKKISEYWQFRNMTQTIIKDFPASLLKKDFNWLRIILVNINTVRFLATKGLLWQALMAEAYILVNLQKLLKKRKEIQENKKVSDEYIIKNFRQKKITLFGLISPGI